MRKEIISIAESISKEDMSCEEARLVLKTLLCQHAIDAVIVIYRDHLESVIKQGYRELITKEGQQNVLDNEELSLIAETMAENMDIDEYFLWAAENIHRQIKEKAQKEIREKYLQ